MPATTRDLRTTHVASNHGWWQHSWVMIAITSDGSKNTRCQQPHAIPVTTLGVDCIMMIYQARILSLSFDIQWEYDVSSRCDVSSKCSLPTGTCFSTGNSLVYIHNRMHFVPLNAFSLVTMEKWAHPPLWLAVAIRPSLIGHHRIHGKFVIGRHDSENDRSLIGHHRLPI